MEWFNNNKPQKKTLKRKSNHNKEKRKKVEGADLEADLKKGTKKESEVEVTLVIVVMRGGKKRVRNIKRIKKEGKKRRRRKRRSIIKGVDLEVVGILCN